MEMIKDRLSTSHILVMHFVDNYTHYEAISVTIFFVRRQFYQTLLKLSGAFNLQLLY